VKSHAAEKCGMPYRKKYFQFFGRATCGLLAALFYDERADEQLKPHAFFHEKIDERFG
jgi:hypothetical protein